LLGSLPLVAHIFSVAEPGKDGNKEGRPEPPFFCLPKTPQIFNCMVCACSYGTFKVIDFLTTLPSNAPEKKETVCVPAGSARLTSANPWLAKT
jgi:hypothetical protein